MVRTQIYLTEEEQAALSTLSAATGKAKSELIRQAVDSLLAQTSKVRRDAVLDRVAGLWKDRDDLPDFTALRKEWDRGCPT
jgi:hypothetical protein